MEKRKKSFIALTTDAPVTSILSFSPILLNLFFYLLLLGLDRLTRWALSLRVGKVQSL
jgi:hypothetical protein